MKTKKQPSLKQQLVVTILMLIALGGAQPFLWGYVKASADALHARRTEEQQLQELQARIHDIETKYKAGQPLIDQLSVPFPKTGQTSQVVDRLEQLADKTGVAMEITNILTDPPSKKGGGNLNSFVVTVRVDGTAHGLLQYIDALEHIQEVVTLRQWVFNAVPVSATIVPGAKPTYPFSMNMNVVFYLQQ